MTLKRRRLGRTGLLLPELGLGAMDTPQGSEGADTLRAALDLGVRLVDTARDYAGSEYLIGQVVRERGDDFRVASKTFSRTVNGSQADVDRSLAVLGVPSICLYQLHDVSTPEAWDQVMAPGGALEGLRVAQFRGLIDHVGISSHSLEIAEKAITSGEFDTVMLEYSAFYTESEDLIDLAAQSDVGVIVMRPLGGSGRMSTLRTLNARGHTELTPELLLRYVLSNPGISAAIPGARFPDRVRRNVALCQDYEPLTDAEKRRCERAAEALY